MHKKYNTKTWFYNWTIDFFHRHGVQPKQFFRNAYNYYNGSEVIATIKKKSYQNLLINAFNWSNTLEGTSFWFEIHKLFVSELDSFFENNPEFDI